MSQTEKGAMDHPERVRVGEGDEEVVEEQGRRTLPPIALPLLALLFTVLLVWSFSRILLAVSHDIAPLIALLVAANVLVGSALVAYGSRVRRRPTSFPLLMVAGLAVVAAGFVASGVGGPEEEGGPHGGQATVVSISARNLEFNKEELEIPAGANVRLEFNNQEQVQHNVSIYEEENAQGEVILRGQPIITGPAVATYSFTAPPPGSYYFQCDVHPNMNGTVKVTEGGAETGADPGGETGGDDTGGSDTGGGGEGVELAAQNVAFSETELTIPAEGRATIHFDNKDQVPHNVAIFEGDGPQGEVVFRGDTITATSIDYTFEAPPPGRYYFHCDVHPNMNGTISVT